MKMIKKWFLNQIKEVVATELEIKKTEEETLQALSTYITQEDKLREEIVYIKLRLDSIEEKLKDENTTT